MRIIDKVQPEFKEYVRQLHVHVVYLYMYVIHFTDAYSTLPGAHEKNKTKRVHVMIM